MPYNKAANQMYRQVETALKAGNNRKEGKDCVAGKGGLKAKG